MFYSDLGFSVYNVIKHNENVYLGCQKAFCLKCVDFYTAVYYL